MLRRASSFFGASSPEDAEAKEAKERAKRAQRLQQRRSQTVKHAAHLLPRSPDSTSFSVFDNAPPVASSATEFDNPYETKGKGRRQLNPLDENKQKDNERENVRIDQVADERGVNRAQAKVLLAQNPGLGISREQPDCARPSTSFFSRSKFAGSTATVHSFKSPPLKGSSSSPSLQERPSANISPESSRIDSPTRDVRSPMPHRNQTASPRPYRGSPAQQIVRFANDEAELATPAPRQQIVSDSSPRLPQMDFGSPRSPPVPQLQELTPALSLGAFGLNRSQASSIESASANYSFSNSTTAGGRYGLGVTLPPAQVTTVGGLRGHHAPSSGYNESMIYDAAHQAASVSSPRQR